MPETVIMMLNRWIWLPLIHIMKHMKPMFLSVPVARPYSADCFASSMPRSLAGEDALAACRHRCSLKASGKAQRHLS